MKTLNALVAGLLACGLLQAPIAAHAQEPAAAPAAPKAYTEAEAMATLQAADAAWEAKADACRALRQVGTTAAVPALAPLLLDEKLSHYARYALQEIPGREAGKALAEALASANDAQKIGIAGSLGARREEAAVPALAELLASPSDEVSNAAAAALGRIGSMKSAKALQAYAETVPDARRVAVGEGLLAAAQHLGQESEPRYVSGFLDPLMSEPWPEQIRLGAFETKARALPNNAHAAIVKALGAEDAKLRDSAAALVAELDKSKTQNYVRALPKLPPAGQASLIKALGLRGDPAAEPALIDAVERGEPAVRAAAIEALGNLDTPGAIPVLAKLLTPADAPESAVAHEALRVSRAQSADTILSRELRGATLEQQAQLIDLLTDRLSPQAIVAAKKVLDKEADPGLRLAAWRALAQLGGAEEVAVVLAKLPEDAQGEESAAAAKALATIAAHEPEAALPKLVEALAAATPQRMPVLVRTLPRVGNAAALEQAVALLGHADATVQEEAAKALGDWPTGEALPHLLSLAQQEDAAKHEAGLRGYVRIARTEQDPAKRGELLDAMLPLAKKKEEKWAVLAAYGTVLHPHAFDALQAQLQDAEVKNEAGAAIISVASELGKNADLKQRSMEALDAVLVSCDQQGVKDRAAAAKEELSKG